MTRQARITPIEESALLAALSGNPYPVYIFGSRADPMKKGGDIDILLLARGLSEQQRFELSLKVASRFRSELDQKLDVVVFSEDQLTEENEAFLASIRERGWIRFQN